MDSGGHERRFDPVRIDCSRVGGMRHYQGARGTTIIVNRGAEVAQHVNRGTLTDKATDFRRENDMLTLRDHEIGTGMHVK